MRQPRSLLVVALTASIAAALPLHAQQPAVSRAPLPAGKLNEAALADVLDYAKAQRTTGFLIIQNGRAIVEQNWPVDDSAVQFNTNFVYGRTKDGALLEDVASQQKSFAAVLVGVAIDKGLLDIARAVSFYTGPGWSKASAEQETAITVRNLLQMNSGLRENLTFERPPDTAFFYNTPAYAVLLRVLEGAAKQSLDDLTRQWLTVPLGMANTSWRMRPNATAGPNARGLVTTPRDIAKIGQLVLDGGRAPDGTVVISRAQLDAMFVRTATNPAYGRLWWLNGGEWWVAPAANARRTEGAFIPAAPPDTVAAMGAMDRKLFVVPSLKLIVVRTGPAAPDRDVNQQLWLRLAKALK